MATTDQLKFFSSLFHIFNSNLDTGLMIDSFLLKVINYLRMDAGAILFASPSRILTCVSLIGFNEKDTGETCAKLELAFNHSTSWGNLSGKFRNNGNAAENKILKNEGFKQWHVVPLKVHDQIMGAMVLFRRNGSHNVNSQDIILKFIG